MKTVGHQKYQNQVMSDNDIDCLMSAKHYIAKFGYPPLYSEIGFNTGLTKGNVVRSMTNLVDLGMVHYNRQRARGYIITLAGQMFKPAGYKIPKKHYVWGHYELTDIELETMRAINALFVAYQVPPSLTEVANRVGLSSTAHAAYIINCLREKHYIQWQPEGTNQFIKVIRRTEKGVEVGIECPIY